MSTKYYVVGLELFPDGTELAAEDEAFVAVYPVVDWTRQDADGSEGYCMVKPAIYTGGDAPRLIMMCIYDEGTGIYTDEYGFCGYAPNIDDLGRLLAKWTKREVVFETSYKHIGPNCNQEGV